LVAATVAFGLGVGAGFFGVVLEAFGVGLLELIDAT
jgi:hypothetical protein